MFPTGRPPLTTESRAGELEAGSTVGELGGNQGRRQSGHHALHDVVVICAARTVELTFVNSTPDVRQYVEVGDGAYHHGYDWDSPVGRKVVSATKNSLARGKHMIRVPVWVVTLVCVAVAACPSQPAHADTEDVIDGYLNEVVGSGVPGIATVVLRKEGGVSINAAGSAADGAPMTVNTPLRIESVSKSFTSMAVMQLVEKGEVELDRPVHSYVPEFDIADPRGSGITVRQLLDQTSGMTDATAPDLYDGKITTLQQAVTRLKTAELASSPGDVFNYHNPNYHVLARLVEVVGQESFDDYLSRHVFAPLKMTSTRDTRQSTDRVPGMAQGHVQAYGRAVEADGPKYFAEGSGGVVSTAADMAKWLQMNSDRGRLADGSQLVSSSSVDLMHDVPLRPGSEYGFGWYNGESAEGPPRRISHSGAGGGFSAYQGIFPDSGDGVVVMINRGAGLTAPDASVLAQNLLHRIDSKIPQLKSPSNGLRTDLILTALGLVTVGSGVVAVVRAGTWARRRARSGGKRVWGLLRLLPWLMPIAWFVALPFMQLRLTGRTAPYSLLFSVSPVAMTWFSLWAVVCGAVIVVRLGFYVRHAGSARLPLRPL